MKTEPKKRVMIRTKSPHHRVTYSNSVQATATNVDLRLRFGCIDHITDEEIAIEDQVDVILGPIEAKGLQDLLGRILKRYDLEQVSSEEEVGIGLVADDAKTSV